MPEPKPKPRRSIFDTLKKSADGRLGLAEAANLADKISVFPVRPAPPPPAATLLSPSDPESIHVSDQLLDQQSDHNKDHLSDHLLGQESGLLSGPLSGHVTRQESGPLSGHEPTSEPTSQKAAKYDPTHEPDHETAHEPTPAPTGRRDDDPDIRRVIRSLPENKRRFLHFIIDNEPAGDDYILNRQSVATALHFTEISVKRYFAEFAALGFFHKETYRRGVCQGLRLFLSRARCQAFKQLDPTHDPTNEPKQDPTLNPTNKKDTRCDPTPDPTSYKEDRKKDLLSISSERMAMTWPTLHRAGFGSEQIRQIAAALAELGKATDKVVQGLDHAEWELAGDVMRDKDGQPVDDPCAWVFASLARTGYYRRPKGYISPEEQAARDAEEEARAVATARQKAEQARFETWRDGLSPEELAKAMRGHIGGPRDAWLKVVWRKSGGGGGA